METVDQKIKKNAALSGVLFGLISLALTIFLFYFITTMTSNAIMVTVVGPVIFSFLIPIGIAIYFCFDLRKKTGGFWTYKQAVTGIFIMFFVGYLVSFAGNFVFSKVIEPDMIEKMKTVFVKTTSTMMQKRGMDQDAIDKQVATVEASFDGQKNPTIGVIARGFGIAVVIYFVVSLIFAAFFKREALLYGDNLDTDEIDATA